MKDWFSKVETLALNSPSQEICGFLLFDGHNSLNVYPVVNVSETPDYNFRISGRDIRTVFETGLVAQYYHSHVAGKSLNVLSEQDIEVSKNCGIPVVMFCNQTRSFHRFAPSVPDLLNRTFVLGYTDCVSLVADWYTLNRPNCPHSIPYIRRNVESFRHGFAEAITRLLTAGFSRTTEGYDHLQVGDVLLFAIGCADVNHIGVYTGDGKFLHHEFGASPTETFLDAHWQRELHGAYRPKNL